MKKISAIFISAVLVLATVLTLVGCAGEPKAAAIILKQAPTVTSKYNEDLAISNDGLLSVKYEDDKRAEVKITLQMIDTAKFNKKSLDEQTLNINYGGKTVSFSFKLLREATSISVKKAPTVTSVYTGVQLEIANDGVLSVNYKDGATDEVAITTDMLDLSTFDIDSTAEQSVTVNYGGKTTSFSVTLLFEEENNEGTIQTFRFEAESAELEDQATTEFCGGQLRADDSEEECVKNLFLSPVGGKVTFRITSNKKTQATIKLCISMQINGSTLLDNVSTLKINGVTVDTNIVLDPGDDTGGWWAWKVYEVSVPIHLLRGENVIEFSTNQMSGKEKTDVAGGRNFNWIELDTTGILAWVKNEQ